MMWLRDLGTFMQNRYGGWYLGLFILVAAAGGNLAQYYFSGPLFGGMSGVNYALFGFLWIRGKFDRFATWRLNPVIVQTMLLWFFLCFTPLIPNVANAAHFAGLALGMLWGYVSAKLRW
jgi:GlpG protein